MIMDFWTMILTGAIVACSIVIWYTMAYFKNTGVPYEKPWPILGNMAPVLFRRSHFATHVSDYYIKWPDARYFGFYDFVTPVIVVRDVELIKSIAVKHFDNFPDHRGFVNEDSDPLFGKSLFGLKGSKWREVRTLLSPAFTASKMKQMFELISVCAKDFSEFIVTNAKKGTTEIDIKDAFTKYTNDVIATCAFGISVNSLKDPNNDFYVLGKNATMFSGLQTLKTFFTRFWPSLAKWLNIQVFDQKVTNFFLNIIQKTIDTREKEGISRPDMIQLMMEAREKGSSEFPLDIVDMTAQAFIFFFAGFETSSTLMSFAAIMLAKYPDIQARLLEEIDEVMKETNRNPTYEAINGMPYLEALLYETLRFYPIVGFLDRICNKSFELPPALPGLKPYTVKAGMNVWFPAGGIHRDPKHYDNPDTFDPDRFFNVKMNVNSPKYLGFGIGPRSCIGNRFALLENKLSLFHLLAKCKFEKSPKLKEPIMFKKASLVVTVDGGFWIKVVPR